MVTVDATPDDEEENADGQETEIGDRVDQHEMKNRVATVLGLKDADETQEVGNDAHETDGRQNVDVGNVGHSQAERSQGRVNGQ